MDWINVKDSPLPKDGENYLALFKGQFCLVAWDDERQKFMMMWMPNMYDRTWIIEPEQECKFTHWCNLEHPKDY